MNNEQFQEKIKEKKGDSFKLIGNYINYKTEVEFYHTKCESYFSMTPSNFFKLNKNYCPKCSPVRKRTDKEFREDLLKALPNTEIITKDEIKNVRQKIKVKCLLCNNERIVEVRKLLEGRQCSCNRNIKLQEYYDESKLTLDKCKKRVKELDDNYEILDEEYIDCHTPMSILHKSCGKISKISINNFVHEHTRCKCQSNNKISLKEKEVVEFIKSFYNGKIITNDKTVLDGKELDIYVPELKLAIEFDGLYWHSDANKSDREARLLHINKTEECLKKDIQLIHIFEDEWIYKQKLVKDKLKTLLKCNKKKIYARECIIKEIPSNIKNEFLNKNHIQGKDSSRIKLGLFTSTKYYEKETLVAVMTFCKPRKSLGQVNTKYDYELSRFASLLGYNVIGGFSKLFKYFEKNYEWNNIITYADRRWSNGNLYLKCGFNLDHISKPSYWYVKNKKREYRYTYRKTALKELFPDIYDDNKTEKEIMKESGYYRIYDCGNIVFNFTK